MSRGDKPLLFCFATDVRVGLKCIKVCVQSSIFVCFDGYSYIFSVKKFGNPSIAIDTHRIIDSEVCSNGYQWWAIPERN